MSLTFQPFENVPEIEQLGKELHRNVPDSERALSALSGVALAVTALSREGVSRWALLAAGAALIGRGLTGFCPLYQQLELDRRHATHGVL